jgi:hypothetical protein
MQCRSFSTAGQTKETYKNELKFELSTTGEEGSAIFYFRELPQTAAVVVVKCSIN